MIIDFSLIKEHGPYSLCVLGTGPAGIITALEYARRLPGERVLLIEFGFEGPNGKNNLDDSIDNRNPVNHHAPYECTNKGLGGSSATWGGRCVMYDAGDFMPRAIIGEACTWDSSFFKECLPFVSRAQQYFESGSGPFDLALQADPVPPLVQGFYSSCVVDTVIERWSLPTRFGSLYKPELIALPNLYLVFGVEARDLPAPDAKGAIPWVGLRDRQTTVEVRVIAKTFVVAMGAQESTRLLLRNPAVFARLEAVPRSLGRYYQGHVSGKIATVRFDGDPRLTEYGFRRERDGTYQRRRFQFTDQALVEQNLLNTAFWLDNPLYFDPVHRNGPMSFMYLAMLIPILGKKLAPPAVAYSITKGTVYRIGAHLLNILRGFPGSFMTPLSVFIRRYLLRRKLPGVFLFNSENRYALHFHAEQIPYEDNRMELGADGETLIIHYSVTNADAEAVIRAHAILDTELRKSGAGFLEYWFPPEKRREAIQSISRDGVHQSGTTRIADDPACGVVNRELRVWGTENLYICSSSVFPTSGQANPTFFLGACAVRLAHHIINNANG